MRDPDAVLAGIFAAAIALTVVLFLALGPEPYRPPAPWRPTDFSDCEATPARLDCRPAVRSAIADIDRAMTDLDHRLGIAEP